MSSNVGWDGNITDLTFNGGGRNSKSDVESHFQLERTDLSPRARVHSKIFYFKVLDGQVQVVVLSDVELPLECEVRDGKVDSKFSSVNSFDKELKISIGINGQIWGVGCNFEIMDLVESVVNINWSIWSVVVADTFEGLFKESSGELEFGAFRDLTRVEESRNWVDLK